MVFAKGKLTPADNGRVKLTIPSQLTVDGQTKTVVGIVAQQVTTKARYDKQFTYSLATAMGDYDFDLVVPATVTSIGDKALANCANLYEVSLAAGSQLATIGAEAFSGSQNMRFAKTRLEADQLSAIGQKAFAGTALRRLALSGNLSAMQTNSFAGADKLEYLDLRDAKGQATANRTTLDCLSTRSSLSTKPTTRARPARPTSCASTPEREPASSSPSTTWRAKTRAMPSMESPCHAMTTTREPPTLRSPPSRPPSTDPSAPASAPSACPTTPPCHRA